jgi:hypothetical protein
MHIDALLDRLNRAVDAYNREVDEAVETGELEPDQAARLKTRPGLATAELVRAEAWPLELIRAVEDSTTQEMPQEVVRLAKSITEPTPIIKTLQHGAARAKGKHPVLINTLHLAHLLARVGSASEAEENESWRDKPPLL